MSDRPWEYRSDTRRVRRGYYDEENQWHRMDVEIRCCGEWLRCGGFTNTCESCGADFNHAGQRLASRAQWGEETGESVDDILSVDSTSTEELLEGAD